jgi:DNA-binding NarL/FixJ family response regulator
MKRNVETGKGERRKRILILDDHPMTRRGLASLLGREPDLMVSGEAESAAQALDAIAKQAPDLVLADITMPGKSGLEFIRDMQALHPNVPILVMSMHDENVYAARALRTGALGYIMKSEGGEKVLEAVRSVLERRLYVSQGISSAMVASMAGRPSALQEVRPAALTDREFEVFQLIGQGLSTKGIARRLNLSIKTIGTHRIHIKEKLGLDSSTDLVKQAIQWAAMQSLI